MMSSVCPIPPISANLFGVSVEELGCICMAGSQDMFFMTMLWPTSRPLAWERERLTVLDYVEGNPSEEECQEGHSVLPDGVWCFWNWYVAALPIRDTIRPLATRKENFQTHILSLQAEPPSSTRSAASLFSSIRKPTMLPTRTLRRASRSSPLRLVRDLEPYMS
jgi:hypothetical protein